MLADAVAGKNRYVETLFLLVNNQHERESSGELLGPSLLANGAGRAEKLYPGAEKLGISKSAISQKISELERVTGKTLVHRTTRSVSLSDDGLRLVAELNEPFGQLRIFSPALAMRRAAAGDAAPDRAGGFFPVNSWCRRSRPFCISIPAASAAGGDDRLVSLGSEGFDLAIRHCRREALPDTHVAWPLCHTATLIVASADYIRRHGRPETPDDLRHHQCLTYPRGPQRPQWTFASRQTPDERVTINVQGPFATNNSESLRDAVLAGWGWRCCRILAPGRPSAAGRCRSCCRRGSRWKCSPIGCTSSGPILRGCRARWRHSAAT
ncbi:LysR family transcriptional regulator [Klebsiella quasipneumoniae]|nr:LysR family transcriptional regulator [Klebsiella quasipneumoniae]